MELEYEDHSKRRKVLILVGILLALVAGGAAFFLISQAQSLGGQQLVMREVIVAARDIPARTQIQASDLTVLSLPDGPALTQAVTDQKAVVQRVAAVAIYAQQPITPNLLASSAAGGQFSILAPNETIAPDSPDWRAVAINVPDDRAVAGQVQTGQRVDVFVTVQVNVEGTGTAQPGPPGATPDPDATPRPAPRASAGAYYTDKSTKITYQDVPVLARNGSMYILRVDAHTAEEISHLAAAGNGSFSLALRADGDDRLVKAEEFGETTNRIISKYGHPIPQVIPLP
jgi:Flp pilus assembly protein CpaB